MKSTKGITLIALIITIIVMLILVAVTITVTIRGGLFAKAGKAARDTQQEAIREEIQSILPFYYLEKDNMTLKEYLTDNLLGDITLFSSIVSTENNKIAGITKYVFNYKGYGFSIDKETLKLTSLKKLSSSNDLESPIRVFEKVSSTGDLIDGAEYIITSEDIVYNEDIDGDFVYVLDECQEVGELKNRKNIYCELVGDTIVYMGDYALKLQKEGTEYVFYDQRNEQYLNVGEIEDNYLGLGENDEYAKTQITFIGGKLEIKFSGKDNYNIMRNNNAITSCYNSGSEKAIALYRYIGTDVLERLEKPEVTKIEDNQKVILTWDEIEGSESYTVLWKSEDDTDWEKTVVEKGLDVDFVKENLTNGKIYHYQVRANSTNNKIINSSWTEEAIAIPSSNTYTLVKSTDELTVGARYLIACPDRNCIAGQQEGAYRKPITGVVITNSTINDSNREYSDYAFRLEASNGKWKFKDIANNGYMACGSKSFKVNNSGTIEFTVESIDSGSGAALLKYEPAAGGAYYVKYNSGSPRFTGYASGQEDVALYKETGSGSNELSIPVVTEQAINGEVVLTITNKRADTDYYLVWNGTELATKITENPHTVTGLTNGTEYTYQIKAVRGDEEKYSAEKNITPIATKTYQLVTSNDDLESGESYLIVNAKTKGLAYTMGYPGGTNISNYEVTILENNTIEYKPGEYNYVLEKDVANNAWKIQVLKDGEEDRYLYTPYTSNTLKTGIQDEITTDDATLTNIDLFKINIDQTQKNAVISGFCEPLQNNCIKFNTNSKIFSFYKPTSGGVTIVYLFKCID